MSWLVGAIGKGEAVGRSLESQFARISPMSEPEQTAKEKTREIARVVSAAVPDQGLSFTVSGSQWSDGTNIRGFNLNVEVKLVQLAE